MAIVLGSKEINAGNYVDATLYSIFGGIALYLAKLPKNDEVENLEK